MHFQFKNSFSHQIVRCAKSLNQMKNLPEYLNENSDLVKNVYEGGLKIWECSQDLVSYLNSSNINLKNQRILELGCGAALPSLYCLKKLIIISTY